MKSILLFTAAISLLLVQYSCFSNKSMLDSTEEEPVFEEATEMEIVTYDGERNPPVAIHGGIENKQLFAGMPNTIKIHVEGGHTGHLEVTCNGGRITPAKVEEGLYSFSEKSAGFVSEIIVKDTITGAKLVKNFDVIDIPAPNAYIGKYRKSFNGKLTFDLASFKEQNAVILEYSTNIPARCNPSSYTMIRIDAKGGKSSCVVQNKSGQFDEAAKMLVDAAKSGDLFIIKDIKSACTKKEIKNIVYEIK